MTNLNTGGIDEAMSLINKRRKEGKCAEHLNARTIDDAVSLLSRYKDEAMVFAGGFDLLGLMRKKLRTPRVLVNIKTIPDLAYIKEDLEGIKIGALTTIKDIEKSALVRDKYGMLADAAHSVGSPLVRNVATVAGNLCQEVRCWYYRSSPVVGPTFHCRRKGGERCFAVDGENQYHAIIGATECNSVCPSDMAPALLALDARLKIANVTGARIVPLEEFYLPLGNILEPDEMITEIQIPTPWPGTNQRYLKFRVRKTIDFAISSVAAAITTEAGITIRARIFLGGVAPIPYRAIRAEQALEGKDATESVIDLSAKMATIEAVPLSQNAYKVPITETLVKRAVFSKTNDSPTIL
ncbi:FAD binding domain-containing protein [Chloroflexota bacterium]